MSSNFFALCQLLQVNSPGKSSNFKPLWVVQQEQLSIQPHRAVSSLHRSSVLQQVELPHNMLELKVKVVIVQLVKHKLMWQDKTLQFNTHASVQEQINSSQDLLPHSPVRTAQMELQLILEIQLNVIALMDRDTTTERDRVSVLEQTSNR